jgi:hypothetical protein
VGRVIQPRAGSVAVIRCVRLAPLCGHKEWNRVILASDEGYRLGARATAGRPYKGEAITRMQYDPFLSCWEGQAEGVHQGAERGETGLDRLGVWGREQMEPG